MAKQVVKLGLEFDTKAAIQSYRDLVSEMSKGGADPKAIKQFTSAIEKAETELAQLTAEGSTGFTDSKGIEQYQKKVLKTVTSMQQLALRMQEFSKSGDNFPTSEVKKLEAEIEKLKKKITDAQKAAKEGLIKSLTTNGGFSKKDAEIIAETVKTEEQLIAKLEEEKKLRDEIRKAAQPAAEKATNAIKDKAVARATSGSQVVMDSVGMKGRKGVKAIREAVATSLQEGIKEGWNAEDIKKNALDAMKQAGISEKLAKEFEASFDLKVIEKELKRVNDDIAKNSAVKKYNEANKSYNQVASGSMENYSQFITKSKEAEKAQQDLAAAESQVNQAALNSANAQKKSANTAGQQATKAEQAANSFMQMSNAQKDSLKSTEQLEGGFNRLADRLKYMFGFTAMFNKLRQIIRSTFNDIQELDKAYASIAYVTNETVADLWSTYDQYANMAEKLGQSTADVIKASAIYRQQGLDTAEALELTTDTMKLATIAGNDYSTATREMTAALRGFKMEMDEGSHVSDVYSELAAHAAASVDDIAQAMSRTASIANSAGMSFENTSAFLTQMIETTQESAENIGTSLKTIIARFTELKENVAGTSESEFEDLSFNKVDDALKSVGVSLKTAQGQFRDLDEVFLELSKKWSTLDRNTQRYIATIAAGSRQQSRFIALMDNYDRTVELIDTVADSEGKADEQFAKAADTIEFKLNEIKTKWEEFKLSIMNSSFVKNLLDIGNKIMDSLKNVKMPQLAIGAAIAIPTVKQFLTTMITQLKTGTTAWKTIGQIITSKIKGSTKKLPINIKIENLENELATLESKKKSIEQKLNSNPITMAVDLPIEKLNELNNSLEILGPNITKSFTSIDEWKNALISSGLSIDQLDILLQQFADNEMLTDEAIKKVIQDLINQKKELNSTENQIQQTSQGLNGLKGVSQGVSSSLSTVGGAASILVSSLISGAGAVAGFKAASTMLISSLVTMATSTIPNVVMAVKAGSISVKGAIASTGIGIAVLAIGLLLSKMGEVIAKAKTTKKTVSQQLEETKKYQSELSNQKSEEKNAIKDQEEKIKNIKDLRDKYEELSIIAHKTNEEEEEYKNIITQIKDQYPELVLSYDETNNKLIVQKTLWEDILDIQTKILEQQQKNYYNTSRALNNATIQSSKEEYLVNKANDSIFKDADSLKIASEKEDIEKSINSFLKQLSDQNISIQNRQALLANGYYTSQNTTTNPYAVGAPNTTKTVYTNASITGLNLEKIGEIYGIDDAKADELLAEIQKNPDLIKNAIKTAVDDVNSHNEQLTDQQIQAQAQAFKDYYEMTHKDAGEGELAFAKGIAASNERNLTENSKVNYGHDNWNSVTDAFGGAESGFSDWNDFSSYEDVWADQENKIKGFKVGNQSIDTVGKALEYYETMFESAEQAKEFWERNATSAEGQKKILNKIVEAIQAEQAREESEEFMQNLSSDTIKSLDNFYEAMAKNGTTSEEIANAENYISSLKNSGIIKDNQYQDIIDNYVTPFKTILEQATNEAISNGMDEGLAKSLTSTQLESYNQQVKQLSENIGEDNAKSYMNQSFNMLKSLGLDEDTILSTIQSIDWTKATAVNMNSFKESAIKTLESAGIAGSERFFAEWQKMAKEKGAFDITIKNKNELKEYLEELEKIRDAALDSKDTIISALAEQAEKGSIKLATFQNLQKKITELGGNITDFVSFDDSGKIFIKNEKALDDFYKKSISLQAQNLRAQIQQEENELHLLEEEEEKIKNHQKEQKELVNKINLESQEIQQMVIQNRLLAEQIEMQKILGKDVSSPTTSSYTSAEDSAKAILNMSKQLIQQEDDRLVEIELEKKQKQELISGLNEQLKLEQSISIAAASEYDLDKAEKFKEITKNQTDALKAKENALKDVREAQKKYNEAIQEYNDLIYGSKNRKSSLDLLYNYKEAVSAFSDELTRAKELFEDSSSFEEANKNLNRYLAAAHNSMAEYAAQNEVLKIGLEKRKNNLLNGGTSYEGVNVRFGDYVKIDERTGLAAIDQRLLQEARFADKWKDQLESFVDDYNKYSQELLKNEDAMRKMEKEIQQMRMDATKKWADFEKDIAETLKNEYQEEVNQLKEKYESMKDADDDYLNALQEAIDKQRKLRDKEKKWDDLARKEKKLSLMNRDTSGANQIDRLKMQQEIEQDRESLLDESIDEVIENMGKIYESQQELRDSEIELKEALLDDALYWNLTAQNVSESFTSVDEFLAWSVEHHKEYLEMTDAQKQEFLDQEQQKFDEAIQASAILAKEQISEVTESIQINSEEINRIVETTGEAYINETQRVMNETEDAMRREIQTAIDKINDAKTALDEANQKLLEASQNINQIAGQLANLQIPGYTTPLTSESNTPPPQPGESGYLGTATGGDVLEETGASQAVIASRFPQAFNALQKYGYHVYTGQENEEMNKFFAHLGYQIWEWPGKQTWGISDTSSGSKMAQEQAPYKQIAPVQKFYASGGLVNYTGPAWVDGTPNKPEAFLSAEDTERIGNAAKLLSNIPMLSPTANTNSNNSFGDTNIEINLNIDHISSDVDVDEMLERVKQEIVEIARPIGTNVILQQQV